MADWFDTQQAGWGGPQTTQAPQGGTAPPVNGNTTAPDPNGSGFTTGTFTGGGQYPLASVMGTGLMQPWTTPFQAPGSLTESNDPGYAARMKLGAEAIQRSAAAHGTLLTGGTLKDLASYGQTFGSNEYSNVYNRALGEYTNAYNIFGANQNNQFNRLSSLSSSGQNAAAGQANAATNYGNSASNLITGVGNAQAAGQVGSANAWSSGLSNTGQTLADLWAMQNYSGYGR